jgi:hypothetical protein
MEKTNRTISLDIHDWSILRNRFDLLLTLKEHYPDMKVSLFTIPYDYAYEMSDLRLIKESALVNIERNKDWLEFIPHGLVHFPREFEKADRDTMLSFVNNIRGEMVKSGIPEDRIARGFCAPQWLWNQDVIDVLNEYGWWGAIDRNQPDMLRTKKYYIYSHSIDEPFWLSNQNTIKLHGHISLPSSNNLEDCLLKLLKMPVKANWKFVSELVE